MQRILNKESLLALAVLVFILFARLVTLDLVDLLDPTESRYAVVGQEMLLRDNWLTPKVYQQGNLVPYLGKPPLHFWLIATAYKIFGMEVWAARFPSYLSLLLSCFFLWKAASVVYNKSIATNSLLIFCSSCFMFLFSGSCVVDVSLSTCITMAISSFILFVIEDHKREKTSLWGIIFFIALAGGFLIKGPIALVLSLLPVFIWLKLRNSLHLFLTLPWIVGLAVFSIISVPWFVLQEISNPGFIKYFFVNENFLRFLVKDYGDMYGSGHEYFRGSAWWMLFVVFLPWSFILCWEFYCYLKNKIKFNDLKSHLSTFDGFFLISGLAPAIFFTLVKQLHLGYLLPALSGLAVYLAVLLGKRISVVYIALCSVLLYLSSIFILANYVNINNSSATMIKFVVDNTKEKLQLGLLLSKAESPYFYVHAWPLYFSREIDLDYADLENLKNATFENLIIRQKEIAKISPELFDHYQVRKQIGQWFWYQRSPAE